MGRDLFADPNTWAQANFGGAELGRQDRTDRLVYSAARVAAASPGASFPAAFEGDRNDLRAFYALMHRKEATHQAILEPHFALTKAAMSKGEVVLVVHDTTELDFTPHEALHDHLGPIGDGNGRGLLQHNSLAVRASDGMLLGLAFQQLLKRKAVPTGQTSAKRKRRDDRESMLWRKGFEGTGEAPEGVTLIDVCDRGGDDFLSLYRSVVGLGHRALVRACQDRCILVEQPDGDLRADTLMAFARGLPGRAFDTVLVSQKGGRPARQARVELGGAEVLIEPPKQLPKRKQYKNLRVWVVRVWEPEPPQGQEALEWVLISAGTAAEKPEDLLRLRDWYAMRWPTAEDFHQAEKTGCREERVRFQDGESLQASLAVLSAVAVRLMQLRQVARACPEEPATRVASEVEVEVLGQTLGVAAAALTVRAFVRGVAKLGGFLGRKCDGEPGWKTLWRGYQKLQALVEGVLLCRQMQQQRQAAVNAAPAAAAAGSQRPP